MVEQPRAAAAAATTKASQLFHQHPQLPATYIALYPYKPQKPDELELKKGCKYINRILGIGFFGNGIMIIY